MDPATKLLLKQRASALDVRLDDDQLARLSRYQELLSTWNTRINLTSVTDPSEVADRHFLDSLAPVPFLLDVETLVDVGAGAGFPGSVIAIDLAGDLGSCRVAPHWREARKGGRPADRDAGCGAA